MFINYGNIIDGGIYYFRFSGVLYIILRGINTNDINNRGMSFKGGKSASFLLLLF